MRAIDHAGPKAFYWASRMFRSASTRARDARAALPTVRLRLVVFATVCAGIAMVVLTTFLVVYAGENSTETQRQIEKQAIAITRSIESEVEVTAGVLKGLATSPALQSGDLSTFYGQAKALVLPPGSRILLYEFDASGKRHTLLNTALAFGAPQPILRDAPSDRLVQKFLSNVVATRAPQVSDVVISSLNGQQITAVGIPVIQSDSVRYVLVGVLPAIDSAPIFGPEGLPPQWFSAVVDRGMQYVAGNRAPDHAANLPVLDEQFRRAVARGETVIKAHTEDGRALYAAVSRSNETGWLSVVAVPQRTLDAPWYRALLIVGSVGGVLLLTTFGLAFVAEPQVARPLRSRLIEDEERFRVMANAVPSILFTADRQGRCDYVSDAFYAYTGMPAGSAEGLGWADALHPEDRKRVLDLLTLPMAALRGRDDEAWSDARNRASQPLPTQPADTAVRLRTKDGTYRWFLICVRVVSDASGRPIKRFGTATDIDDRMRTERQLRQSEHEMRRVSAQLMKIQDDERQRIAREIHDSTLQDLAAAAMQIDLIRNGAASEPETGTLDDVRSLLLQSQQDLRTLSYVLHPPVLDELGLAMAIRWYARGFEQRSGIRVSVEAPPEMPRLSEEVERALFRVVPEALSNVHRHSGSSEARILLQQNLQSVVLEIADRGKGMGALRPAPGGTGDVMLGVGIPGMRLRLQQIGGRMEISSSAAGTTLRAVVPRNHPIDHAA